MIFQKLLSNPESIKEKVSASITHKKSLLLTYFNQHCLNVYYEDQVYRNLIEFKFNAYQADFGVYLAVKFLNNSKPQRIESTSINEKILTEFIARNVPVAIIGGRFQESFVIEEAKKRGINLVYYKDGFFEDPEVDVILRKLNNTEFQAIFVGMGVPKQELFAEQLARSLQKKVIICVGIFFEYYFGTTKRAPMFLRKLGLEWMFRLFSEPNRLWGRYIVGIPEFIFRIIRIKLGSSSTN